MHAEDISEIKMNELPPPPPIGIFDARYTSGRYIEEIGENGKEIIINSADYPVKIKVEGAEINITANGEGVELNRNIK